MVSDLPDTVDDGKVTGRAGQVTDRPNDGKVTGSARKVTDGADGGKVTKSARKVTDRADDGKVTDTAKVTGKAPVAYSVAKVDGGGGNENGEGGHGNNSEFGKHFGGSRSELLVKECGLLGAQD